MDKNTENFHKYKNVASNLYEKLKDDGKVEKGSLGGKAFWRNHYGMKADLMEKEKELSEIKDKYRQTKLDLDMFRVLSKSLNP